MRPSYTSVVERRKQIDNVFHSHPYEAAWALEAVFFLTVEHNPHPALEASVEISADGLHWVGWGNTASISSDENLIAVPVDHFGHWLRLTIGGADYKHPAVVTIQLALKG